MNSNFLCIYILDYVLSYMIPGYSVWGTLIFAGTIFISLLIEILAYNRSFFGPILHNIINFIFLK